MEGCRLLHAHCSGFFQLPKDYRLLKENKFLKKKLYPFVNKVSGDEVKEKCTTEKTIIKSCFSICYRKKFLCLLKVKQTKYKVLIC